jgi:hypothetical protein
MSCVIKPGRNRWARHVVNMGKETYIQGFGGKTWCKSEDNIKMDLQEVGLVRQGLD